jgi:hypothetical protein
VIVTIPQKPFFIKEYVLNNIEQANQRSQQMWTNKLHHRPPSPPKTHKGKIKLFQMVEQMYARIWIAGKIEIKKNGDFSVNWLTWDVDRNATFRERKEDFLGVVSHRLLGVNRGLSYREFDLPVRISSHTIQRVTNRTPNAQPEEVLEVLKHPVLSAVALWTLFASNSEHIVDSEPFLLSSIAGSFVGDYAQQSKKLEIRTFLSEEDMSWRKKSMATDVGIWSFSHADTIEDIALRFSTYLPGMIKNGVTGEDPFSRDVLLVCNSYAKILQKHKGVLEHYDQRLKRKINQDDLWAKARAAQQQDMVFSM